MTTRASLRRNLRRGPYCVRLLLASTIFLGAASDETDYTDLDIQELQALSTEVTSVSRRTQRLLEVPAAVSVISGEDIQRSFHTSIPELLRLAPGMHAARV